MKDLLNMWHNLDLNKEYLSNTTHSSQQHFAHNYQKQYNSRFQRRSLDRRSHNYQLDSYNRLHMYHSKDSKHNLKGKFLKDS